MARHAASGPTTSASPTADSGPQKPGPARGRVLVGGGAALVVVAGVALVALTHGGGQPGDTAPTSNALATQQQDAIGPTTPGTPIVTATKLSATQVEFRWTYDNSAAGDTYSWKVTGTVGNSSGGATKPEHTVTVPTGKVACFEVMVTSASSQVTSYSQPDCWP